MDDENETQKNPHASALSAMGASKGGKERARRLTPDQRSLIARKAAQSRWDAQNGAILKATHEGTLNIPGFDFGIPCAVLEDGTRVLSRIGFMRAIGRTGKAKGGRRFDEESKIPVFLTATNLKPFLSQELLRNCTPVSFRPVAGGVVSIGYRAELLRHVCNVFINARKVLLPNQAHIADQCTMLLQGFAEVGIAALIDEATGFQRDRAADALAKILEEFVAKELRKWVRTFPPDFYKEMFRLRKIPYSDKVKRPQYIGHLTNDVVYSRLAPGVLDELRVKNPALDGRRKAKHFQWLTEDVGNPKLLQHLSAVIALMRAADDWDGFRRMIDRAFKPYQDLPLFREPRT